MPLTGKKLKAAMPFIKLIRWKNLLILFATLFITAFLTLQHYFNFTVFALYAVSVIFIAAAGYALNDYFDAGIDAINKPEKLIAGKVIPLIYVLTFSITLYSFGVICAIILGKAMHQWIPVVLLLFAAVVTIIYAAFLKKKLIWGNVAVAFTAAGPVMLPWIFSKVLSGNIDEDQILNQIIIATFVFAWLMHFAREIIKDIEDINGDKEVNCRSIPICFSRQATINTVKGLMLLTILLLLLAAYALFRRELVYSAIYLIISVAVPMMFYFKKMQNLFMNGVSRNVGNFIKLMMLTGLLTLVVLNLEMNHL